MNAKRAYFLFLVLFFYAGIAWAGELTAKEAVIYFKEGVGAQKDGNLDKAELSYQKTLLLDPANREYQKFILNNRGVMLTQVGDLAGAEAAFVEVLKMDPAYQPAQLNLGLVYDKQKNRLKALEYWARVFDIERLKPKNFIIEEQQQQQKKKKGK